MIKGIIFDADGTLLDSMHIWGELGARYLSSIGKKAEEGLAEILFTMSLEESGAYLKKAYDISDSVEKIMSDMLNLIEVFYKNEAELKKGAAVFLEFIKQKNIPAVIATSGNRELLLEALKRLRITDYFSEILTCTELKTSKKEPLIYLRATEIIGTQPEETAVFEDVLHGIKTAKNAGFVTFAVEDEASKNDRDEIKTISDYYIIDFTYPVLYEI